MGDKKDRENIIIYEASAGSGKTYQIALNYLKIIRENHSLTARNSHSVNSTPPAFKDIIAITFTNKAVFEMKERILRFLKEIVLQTEKGREISSQTGIGKEEAEALLEEIFLNYDYLEIRTIDSLLLKFFRGLAYEFDLHPNFDIRTYVDYDSLEKALFNLYLRSQEEKEIRNFLEDFINFHLTKESKLKINLKRKIINQLQEYIGALTHNEKLVLLLEDRDAKYGDSVVSERGRLYFRLLKLLKDELERILLEKGIVYMGYWKEKLAQSLHEDHIPWVYVKFGKIRAFIIDEFQDTDKLQWIAMSPLVEELTSDGRPLILAGDPKQSIYRWKGADPTLLIQIRENYRNHNISLRPLTKNFRSCVNLVKFNNLFFKMLTEGAPRSEILRRLIFGKDSKIRDPEVFRRAEIQFLQLFSNVEQEGHRELDGKIYIYWLEFPRRVNSDELNEEITKTVGSIIRSLYEEGSAEEIAILCRENEDVAEIANHLTSLGFKVIGSSFLKLRESPVINGLIALLKLFYSREVDIALATVLFQFFKEEGQEIFGAYRRFKRKTGTPLGLVDYVRIYHSDFWKNNFEELFERGNKLNLYQFLTLAIDRFKLENRFPEERAYLSRFLSLILKFVAGGGETEEFLNNLDSFLEEDVEVIHDEKVIQVMTLHASKGLEFDRVIIPLNFSYGRTRSEAGFLITEEGIFKGKFEELPKDIQEYYIELKAFYNLELLSLLYVGFTRAKRELHLIVPCGLENPPVSAEIFISTFKAVKELLQKENLLHLAVEEISVPHS